MGQLSPRATAAEVHVPGAVLRSGSSHVLRSPSAATKTHARVLGHVGLFATPWAVAQQAPLSMESTWLFTSPGDLPNPGIEPTSPALAGGVFTAEPPGRPQGMSDH